MKPYMNRGGNSGIAAYACDNNAITIRFKGGATYLYTEKSAGPESINTMKSLADRGQGLNSYISRFVKKRYAARLA